MKRPSSHILGILFNESDTLYFDLGSVFDRDYCADVYVKFEFNA